MSVMKYKDPVTGEWVNVGGIYSGNSVDDSIPSYVRTEAERVAKRVQSHQNSNTITFIACADIHYTSPDNASPNTYAAYQKEAATSLGQAMKLIREKVHVDFAAFLGDAFWDGGETAEEALSAVRFVNGCLHEGFVGIPAFRLRGNHDDGYNSGINFTDEEVFANIGIFNKDVVYDSANRIGGYFYRDFEDLKVRVICLNSSEGGGCLFTEAQTTWMKSALNLTNKGEGWRSIILSHHPLDWGRDGGSNPIPIVNEVTGIICAFHGHIHSLKVDNMNNTEITRICIPNACYSRENQYGTEYGVDWSEATAYPKTPGTAENTAFCVVTIDLAEKKIYADHYGAGYDRVVPYDNVVVETYSITNTLTNVTNSNGEATIDEGASYSATLTANSGYTLNGGTVTVIMGGTDITDSAYSGGKITIASVTGDIAITASAVVEQTGPAYTNRVSTSIDTDGSVYNGNGYQEGYRLNSSGVPAELANAVHSGFIPYNGEVIRVWGTTNSNNVASGNYIGMYDSNFAKLYVLDGNNAVSYGGTWIEKDGKYMLTVDPATLTNATVKEHFASAKYIRASMPNCTGADFVVTLNEEIE